MTDSDFNPNSKDAQFARIIARLDNQDIQSAIYRTDQKESNLRIENLLVLQNGRVRALEREKWLNRGFVAAISVAGTAAWQWWTTKK